MLNIQTFDARSGGNVLYKAMAHPLAAEQAVKLFERLRDFDSIAVFDPDNIASALFAMHPDAPEVAAIYVQDIAEVGTRRMGLWARALTELAQSHHQALLIASFNADRIRARLTHFLPGTMQVFDLDALRIPESHLSVPGHYLDRLNFATNYAFFREQDGLSTRLVTANYWAGYGAKQVRLWLRLFDIAGAVLAEWEQELSSGVNGAVRGVVIDSAEVRKRFNLPEFTGQLFIHAIGAAGHDVVKYALDTYAHGNGAQGGGDSLSCTHDANAWPSERYAGMPAPAAGEQVVLWVQNSHATPIPAGGIALNRMGAEHPVVLHQEIAPYATLAIDVGDLLPGIKWPAQIELRSGRHIVRPRYEVTKAGRTRIAHLNVERADLRPDPGIKMLPEQMGRGYLLPFPLLPRDRFRSIILPTPMAHSQINLPLRLEVFDRDGVKRGEKFLGNLPRVHATAVDLAEFDLDSGHGELLYDFSNGGDADGWLHALMRYEDKNSGHVAESSFGAHIYNTLMIYRDEPQSYSGPAPGLTTRLFLKLGDDTRRSFTCLIYPASGPWVEKSSTRFLLINAEGIEIAQADVPIACSGSALIFPDELFGPELVLEAGIGGYVLIRDVTCRLFGYHGLMDQKGGFSLDHMFGF
jgi:hypothetical protein